MAQTQRIGRDDPEKIILANINEYGWHVIHVLEDDGQPPWSYSIGLFDTWNHPEIIIVGRSRATAQHAIDKIADCLEYDQRPDTTHIAADLIAGADCQFIPVATHHYPDYVGFARWYYRRRDFPLHQLVWPNANGHYPWDERAPRTYKEWQPVLGAPPMSF